MSEHEAEDIGDLDAIDDDAMPVIIELDYSSGSSDVEVEDVSEYDATDNDASPVIIELDYSSNSFDD